jgi:hypothetical protein
MRFGFLRRRKRLDLLEELFDSSRFRRGVVDAELELGSVAKTNALSEVKANLGARVVECFDGSDTVLGFEPADEDAAHAKIGTHFDVTDRHESECDVFQVAPKYFDQSIAHDLSNLGGSTCFFHSFLELIATRTRAARNEREIQRDDWSMP